VDIILILPLLRGGREGLWEMEMLKKDNLISKLKEIVGESHLIQDPDKLKGSTIDGKRPKGIVSPKTIEEVAKIVSYANEQNLTIIPMGSGTKMGMGGIPKKIDIVLLTGRLNRITDCDTDNLTLSVESGITLSEVQRRLSKEGKGYFLPLDPPFTDKATLGGIVATNSSGPKRLLYGTARDLIIGTKTVFPNGDIVVSGGKTVKNVSGYDICKLLIGSFGTLGIICEITFKLLPLPEKEATLWIPFTTIDEANGFVQEIIQSQLIPASMDILNAMAVEKMKFLIPMPQKGNYLVAIGLEGVAEAIERQILEINERGKKQGGLEAMTLNSGKHHSFWIAIRDFAKGLNEAYPNLICLKSNFLISRCREMLGSYEKISREAKVGNAFICHSGNGILFSYLFIEKNLQLKVEFVLELIERLTFEAVKNGGNLLVESSPLQIKKKVDVWGQSRGDYRIMRRLKEQMDPMGVLNPGRFVGGI
jgi:glycolate oxidase FAD binding subunit